ncbi:unnamed protein product [Protopolystoma xenopodis]|uniref:Thiamine pyrophosphate enzyme N-terminal TPP-binding domain-containing protein n=1 Tax=Protopolystoma xenopodis TaxID=117903 RepID=A0A448XG65_9PLAT|nr:unnamed protein product [Protopolystoma xenopodis]
MPMILAQLRLDVLAGVIIVLATAIVFKLLRFYGLHLKAHGVKYLFTLCGGHISPILVASEKKNIRVIDVRHEASAVFAADAVSRLSGTVGVAAVTAGPGITNTVTAVKNAQMAETPIVLIGGAASSLLKGRGSLQDIDQLSLFQSVCKYSARVNCVRDIIPVLTKAFFEAASDTPGWSTSNRFAHFL